MSYTAEWGHLIRLLTSPPSPQGEGFGGGLRLYAKLMFVRCDALDIHSNAWGLSSNPELHGKIGREKNKACKEKRDMV